jgi:4-alpha-glucanotransferase
MKEIGETLLRSSMGPQWSRIGMHHHHGINLPLSALHSEKSTGIGEFYDLIPLIDWCANLGMDVIQLLPLNDTGDDTSPFLPNLRWL